MSIKKIQLIFLMLMAVSILIAQNKSKIGVLSSFEANDYISSSKYGLSFEKSISKHWSYETGLFAKNYILPTVNVKSMYANIPMFIKYNTKIINVAIGLNSYYYLGWKYISTLVEPASINLDLFKISFMAKFSKDIELNERLTLEPEVILNSSGPLGSTFEFGAGLKLKYSL